MADIVYLTPWHLQSLRTKVAKIIVMRKCQHPLKINVKGFVPCLSMQFFSYVRFNKIDLLMNDAGYKIFLPLSFIFFQFIYLIFSYVMTLRVFALSKIDK